MQFFNTALAKTMAKVLRDMQRAGFLTQDEWVVRYVDDALVGSSKPEEHLGVLRVIMKVMVRHG